MHVEVQNHTSYKTFLKNSRKQVAEQVNQIQNFSVQYIDYYINKRGNNGKLECAFLPLC